jgi:L-rhamnose mutarotase
MKTYALTLNLKNDPEIIKQYKAYHANPYPEVVEALKAVGIADMKIWLLGRRLFMVFVAEDNFDPERDFKRYLKLHPRCQEWEDLMSTFQEPVPEARAHEKWALMEQVFQL